jgi:hypothetical protein
MEESKLFTPMRLTKKAAATISSSSLNKGSKDTRNYLPSRFIADKPVSKNLPQELLHSNFSG